MKQGNQDNTEKHSTKVEMFEEERDAEEVKETNKNIKRRKQEKQKR